MIGLAALKYPCVCRREPDLHRKHETRSNSMDKSLSKSLEQEQAAHASQGWTCWAKAEKTAVMRGASSDAGRDWLQRLTACRASVALDNKPQCNPHQTARKVFARLRHALRLQLAELRQPPRAKARILWFSPAGVPVVVCAAHRIPSPIQ